MILRPGIGSHRNLGGGLIHSARIPETMWFNPENVWDSTTQTVYSVTRLSEIPLPIVGVAASTQPSALAAIGRSDALQPSETPTPSHSHANTACSGCPWLARSTL